MDKKVGSKKETRVGLDIGTRLIKIVELAFGGNTPRLTKADCKEIEFPPTEESEDRAIKALLDRIHLDTKDVSIAFSAPHAIVRFINMPRMKPEDLKNSLRFEAEKYIPFNIKEVVIDSSILGYTTEDKRQMRVLFAAVKKKAIDSRIAKLKNLGLSVSIIDIDSFACFNAFCNTLGTPDESKSFALLNLGSLQTNLVISNGTNPLFTRDIQIGARDIAKAISDKLGIKRGEADKFIIEPKNRGAEIFEVAKSILANLSDEVRLSFGYYENQHGKSINEIYMSGGMARLAGISKYFEESFEVKTALWTPFTKFEISPDVSSKVSESMQAQFAVATGLAMRSSG